MQKFILPGAILIVVAVAALGAASYFHSKATPTQESHRSTTSSAIQTSTKKSATEMKIPPAPKSVEQDKVLQEVRSELQAIMVLNKKINATQTTKSAQLMRIQEQAQIHEKILANIKKASGVVLPPSREALLAQEKLRIIREETLRNKKILDDQSQTPSQKTA